MDFRLLDVNAAEKGRQKANGWLEQASMRRAGGMLAEGDNQGARDHLNRAGMIGQAQNLQQQEWATENRQIAADERQIEADKRQREMALADEKREAEALSGMATGLSNVLTTQGKDAVLPAFDMMARTFKAQGASDASIAQMRAELEANPELFLDAVGTAANQALSRYQFNTVEGAVVRSDKKTGDVQEMYRGPKYIQVDPHKNFVEVPGTGSGAPGAASAGPTGAAPGGTGSPLKAATAPEAILELFPNARITGTDRDPDRNKAVNGAARSWHLQQGKAVDMAPIEGETVSSVKAKLEAAGWTVHEALDETQRTNGTGPHWHFAASPPSGAAPSSAPQPSGPRVITAAQPRQTDQWRNMTEQEVAAAGMRPGTAAQVNARTGQTRVAQAPTTARNAGPNGRPRISAQEEITLKDLRKEAAAAQNVRPLLQQMYSLAQSIETGGVYAMPGSATVAGAFDPRIRRFQSLTDQMTPLMRNGLPGAASDRDVAMFRSAAPSMDKPRDANIAGIRAGVAVADRMGDYMAFMDAYANENGTLRGASELWKRYSDDNPIFDHRARGLPRLNRASVPWRQYFSGGVGMPGNEPTRRATQGIEVQGPDGQNIDVRAGSPPATRRRYNPATGRIE